MAQPIEELSFLFPKPEARQTSVFATVQAVGSSELTVRVDGSEVDISAAKGVDAGVGERVFCIITELGALVAVAKIYS